VNSESKKSLITLVWRGFSVTLLTFLAIFFEFLKSWKPRSIIMQIDNIVVAVDTTTAFLIAGTSAGYAVYMTAS
jgi:hypothetical protein